MNVVNLTLNGWPKKFGTPKKSYEQLLELADKDSKMNLTVTYEMPSGKKGSLTHGQHIVIEDGSIINIGGTK
jgi:hypothetical protein